MTGLSIISPAGREMVLTKIVNYPSDQPELHSDVQSVHSGNKSEDAESPSLSSAEIVASILPPQIPDNTNSTDSTLSPATDDAPTDTTKKNRKKKKNQTTEQEDTSKSIPPQTDPSSQSPTLDTQTPTQTPHTAPVESTTDTPSADAHPAEEQQSAHKTKRKRKKHETKEEQASDSVATGDNVVQHLDDKGADAEIPSKEGVPSNGEGKQKRPQKNKRKNASADAQPD